MTSEEYVISLLEKKTEAVEELTYELRMATEENHVLVEKCKKLNAIICGTFKRQDTYFSAYVSKNNRLYFDLCDVLGIEIAEEAE